MTCSSGIPQVSEGGRVQQSIGLLNSKARHGDDGADSGQCIPSGLGNLGPLRESDLKQSEISKAPKAFKGSKLGRVPNLY